jgi:Family of unknown function (DUF6002)
VAAIQRTHHEAETQSVITRYYPMLETAAQQSRVVAGALAAPGFQPSPALPELTPELIRFFEPAQMRMVPLSRHRGFSLELLDLMRNPATRTTKTFPSLLIVARAVAHIRATGERVMIVTPTSGNKGTALRDAVLRAIQSGLVSQSELSVAMVAPLAALPKLWSSPLSAHPQLQRRNPVMLYPGQVPDSVKSLTSEFVCVSADLQAAQGLRLWYTLDLANYIVADAARACFEAEVLPPQAGTQRVHAHAVSSAFGLLGYHLGWRVRGGDAGSGHPQFLLVQHLRTPDMVLGLRESQGTATRPVFTQRSSDGRYVQRGDPGFPTVTDDPDEELDSTFYTRRPATCTTINGIISRYGGGGIVVSRCECESRYPVIREWLAGAGIGLPAEPDKLREWSLVMVLTGAMNAIERGLLPEGAQVVVHASGSYADGDYEPMSRDHTVAVESIADIRQVVERAAAP